MTTYFYDAEAGALIAFNNETNRARVLQKVSDDIPNAVNGGSVFNWPADFTIETPRVKSKLPKGKKGCSICGRPRHNKKTCPNKDTSLVEFERDERVPAMSKEKFERVKLANSPRKSTPTSTVLRTFLSMMR